MAKAYGGDLDTLLAIVLAMAAVVFGIPEEIQNQVKNQLKIHTSEELRSYAQLSDDMDKQCSDRYPENTPLEEQLKQTCNTISEIMKNGKRDIDTINKNIGFNEKVDEIIYSDSSPGEFFWDQKPKTVLFYFILIPIILVGIAFYLLSSELALVALLTICILDFIAFRVIAKNFFSKRENLVLSKISPVAQKSQSEISIDNINIDNEVTRSNEFKQLIESIIKDWNFNLDPNQEYDLNQRKEFEYEVDGKAPEFKKDDYDCYLQTLKEYKSSNEQTLKAEEQKIKTDTDKINEIKRTIDETQRQIDEFEKSTPEQMYDTYINEEKALYKEINAHNRATAEYKTQKKLEKLKSLTPEKVEEINKYVEQINRIAEKYGIEDKIKFDKKKFVEWQIAGKKQIDIVLEQAKGNNLINMNKDQVP